MSQYSVIAIPKRISALFAQRFPHQKPGLSVTAITRLGAEQGFHSGRDFVSLKDTREFMKFSGGGALMVHVLVHHKVADFGLWKETFDGQLNTRKAGGETGFRLFQSVEDPRDVTLLLDWDSVEHARRFMHSNELRDVMQKAGVVGAPDVVVVWDATVVHRTAAD